MIEMELPCPEPDCDEVFTGADANIAVVNHVSAAHRVVADDAAGAVRRTPRPACDCEMFDFCDKCWGPEQQREAQIRQLAYCEEIIPSGPEDAEQCPNPREPGSIHCATHQRAPLPEVMHDAGETAEEAVRRLSAEVVGLRQNQRPVVLLRAEDCACPVGGDCPHGPEPVGALDLAVWLHAESEWWLSQYKHDVVVWRQQVSRTEAERDEAVALCASLQSALLSRLADLTQAAGKERSTEWIRLCATLPMEEWPPAPAYKGPMVPAAEFRRLERQVERLPWRQRDYDRARLELRKLNDAMLRKNRVLAKRTAERDALQARIDDARRLVADHGADEYGPANRLLSRLIAALDGQQFAEPVPCQHDECPADWCNEACPRAALQGDQPAEPDDEVTTDPFGTAKGPCPNSPPCSHTNPNHVQDAPYCLVDGCNCGRDLSLPGTQRLIAGGFIEVHTGDHVGVGQVKHLGNATGPLVVVVPTEVIP